MDAAWFAREPAARLAFSLPAGVGAGDAIAGGGTSASAPDQAVMGNFTGVFAMALTRLGAARRCGRQLWVLLAFCLGLGAQLAHAAPRWVRLLSGPDDPLWTDDYTNVLGVLSK